MHGLILHGNIRIEETNADDALLNTKISHVGREIHLSSLTTRMIYFSQYSITEIYHLDPEVSRLKRAAFSFSFFFTTSMHLFLQQLFLNLIGRLPTYRPETNLHIVTEKIGLNLSVSSMILNYKK